MSEIEAFCAISDILILTKGFQTFSVSSELATVLVVGKKDDRNKKKILKMSMNEAYIWLSGLRFIDTEIFNGYKFFLNFH